MFVVPVLQRKMFQWIDLSLESVQNTTSFNLISNLQRVEDRPMFPEMGSRLGFTPLVALISCKKHAFICFCNYKGSSLLKTFFIMVNFIQENAQILTVQLNFSLCIHAHNLHPVQDIEHFYLPGSSLVPFSINTQSTRGNDYSDFCHHGLVLLILELLMNGTIQYVFFCVWFLCLSTMFLRFICVVLCTSIFFSF